MAQAGEALDSNLMGWLRLDDCSLKASADTPPDHTPPQDGVSLCSPGCPGTQSVDQAGLELRNPPASASQVLGLKVCATIIRLQTLFLRLLEKGAA